jgi:diaminopimelate epimerase
MKDVTEPPRPMVFPSESRSPIEAVYIHTGSPHVVIQVVNVARADVEGIGPLIRGHQLVGPEGANVNFVQERADESLMIRTFERGVEGETLACGTGVVAAALVSAWLKETRSPVRVNVKSGETLSVGFERTSRGFSDVVLTGSARLVFRGSVSFDQQTGQIGDPVIVESLNSA